METKDWTQLRRSTETAQPPGWFCAALVLLVSVIGPTTVIAATGTGGTPAPAAAPPAPAPGPVPAQTPPPPATTPAPGTGGQTVPAPPETSPPYPPPPDYYAPPPPPYQYGSPRSMRRPHGYFQAEEDEGIYRPLSLTLAVGPGMLIGPGVRDVALSYNIFRLGIGIMRNLSLMISYEGAGTNSTSPATGEHSWLSQNQWIFGLQFHFLQWLYVRAGLGPGTVSESTDNFFFSNGTSLTYAGALGFEFLQSDYVALGFEVSASSTPYAHETWETIGWDFTLAFY